MKISVIVPVYNSAAFLDKCIGSIINNTYKNLEIICVNDGSKDNSLEMLRRYQTEDSRIVIIDQVNKGVSAARNAGIQASSGELISFIDADDWIHPLFFDILFRGMEESKSDIIAAGIERIRDESEDLKEVNPENNIPVVFSKKQLFSDRSVRYYTCGKLFRKEVITGILFDEKIHIAEDVLFNADILFRNPSIVMAKVKTPMYAYRDNYGSAVHTNTYKEKYYSMLALYKKIIHYGKDHLFYHDYLVEIIKQLLSIRYLSMGPRGDKGYKRKINRLLRKSLGQLKWKYTKQKMILSVFYCFPSIYRMWRIANDPTLLIQEKKAKKETEHIYEE